MTQSNYPFPVVAEEFKDKRVLVTGGTKGIGEAIVRRFQPDGALVATTARAPIPLKLVTAGRVRKCGVKGS